MAARGPNLAQQPFLFGSGPYGYMVGYFMAYNFEGLALIGALIGSYWREYSMCTQVTCLPVM